MASPRVFSIAASTPFVPTLIRALLEGTLVPGFLAAISQQIQSRRAL
jgi:inactivated superfamily I helicase